MAAVRSDRFDAPLGVHDERVLAWAGSVADDSLAGRTVWCAAALPAGRAAANRLLGLLRGRLIARPLGVAVTEPPAALASVLDPIPAAGLVDVKDAATAGGRRGYAQLRALAWSSILGEVVEADRDDRVGGTLHVRPAMAPR